MLHNNTKSHGSNTWCDRNFFKVLVGVPQGDTLASFFFILSLNYVLRTSADPLNQIGLAPVKARSRRYPANKLQIQNMLSTWLWLLINLGMLKYYFMHFEMQNLRLANTLMQIRSNKYVTTRIMKQRPLEKVEYFIYFGNNILFTVKYVIIQIAKTRDDLNKLRTIWKFCLLDSLRKKNFRDAVKSFLVYGFTAWTVTKQLESKLDRKSYRIFCSILSKPWQKHPTKK